MKYLLKITSFFERFEDLLQGPNFTKEELNAAILHSGPECLDLIHDIHIALLYEFIDEFEEGKRFENAQRYGLVFYLIKHLQDDFLELHFRTFWPELMLSLVGFPDFEEIFTEETRDIFREIAQAGVSGYNYIDPMRKLKAMDQLIELMHELNIFRANLGGLFEKQNEMMKDKAKLEGEIKDIETELTTARQEYTNTEETLKTQEEVLKNLPRLEMPKKRTEIEEIKRKMYKIQGTISKTELQLDKLKTSYDSLKVRAPFLIHPTQMLGKDKKRNVYFFFSDDPSGIYCQETNGGNRGMPCRWTFYNTEQAVNRLLDSLNRHGKRELELYENIKNLLKEQYLMFDSEEGQFTSGNQLIDAEDPIIRQLEAARDKVNKYESIYQPQEDYIKPRMKINRSQHLLEIFRDKVQKTPLVDRGTSSFLVGILLEIEHEFNNYLRTRKCRWAEKTAREAIRKEAKDNVTEAKVAELLVLLNNRFIHIETFLRKDQEQLDDNSENE